MECQKLNGADMPVRQTLESDQDDAVAAGKALIAMMLESTPEEFRDALHTMQARIEAARSPDAAPMDSRQLLIDVMHKLQQHIGRSFQ